MTDDLERGREMARKIVTRRGPPVDEDLIDLILRYAFGSVWARDGLDIKTRRLITLAMTIASNHYSEFKIHLRYALDDGLTREEAKEVMLHAAAYCGFPASLSAFQAAEEVYAELDAEQAGKAP